jgi:hypothetical protein
MITHCILTKNSSENPSPLKISAPIPPSIFHAFFHPSLIFPVTKMSSEKKAFSETDFQTHLKKLQKSRPKMNKDRNDHAKF